MINTRFILLLSCGFLCQLFGYSQLDKGLVSSYYFSGNANDDVGQLNGVIRGASLATDRFGNAFAAYCFDGKNDYISLGTHTDLKQFVMSLSLWVKLNDYKSDRQNYAGMPILVTKARISVQRYEAYVLAVLDNGRFCGANTSTLEDQVTAVTYTKAVVDVWYHLVYMFDTDTSYLYLNGDFQQKVFKGFATNYAVSDSIMFGHVGNNMPDTFKYKNYSWFNGCIDDVKFYNRLLTPREINELYHEPNPKFIGEQQAEQTIKLGDTVIKYWNFILLVIVFIVFVILIIRWRIIYVRKNERIQNELQSKFAQLEMKALRSQMNPHFIFNAINSIQHYVLTNEKELANKYLVKFSQLMRNILDLSKQELITLSSELETINLYLDIESLRFNNAFSYELKVSPDVFLNDVRLPPLIIQPFVENAIWHGLLLKEGNKKLTISVSKKEDYLVIEIDDNGIGREASRKFSKQELKRRSFGMDITQDRLNVLETVFGLVISFNLLDKKDNKGSSLGTTVFINVKL
ncbi:histidine kinase [Aurantibacillus circumpalustris]|uniref:histidine kinase n=1 Tax=Aurantibacillus circumpalustris TaxID=3036359 RepID=UPI00295AC2D7|nr:histidine kinase [Aurantibacillus circumpalustris]